MSEPIDPASPSETPDLQASHRAPTSPGGRRAERHPAARAVRTRNDAGSTRRGLIAAGLAGLTGTAVGAKQLMDSGSGAAEALAPPKVESKMSASSPTSAPSPRVNRRARRAARRRARRNGANGSVARPSATPTSAPVKRPNAKRPNAAGGPTDRDRSFAQSGGNRGKNETRVLPPGRQYSGFGEAARNSKPAAASVFAASAESHLLRRATFGARPADVAALKSMGIDAWLSKQLSPESVADDAGQAAWNAFALAGADPATIHRKVEKYHWDAMYDTAAAAFARQVSSERQLYEQVVDVFANHLHVNLPGAAWDTSPGYYVNVIRKHAMGKFSDMLLAAMQHPAMLQYLDNDVSTRENINENLGRELLELHTVGIGGGYTEVDVLASARVLTGRSSNRDRGTFEYKARDHHVGALKVLGWSSPNSSAAGGLAVGDAYLTYLAKHPKTARNVARKLAVRFVADQPSESLIDRLAQSYTDNDTDIRAVLVTLFRSSDFWSSVGWKSRRPLEDMVGAARVLDVKQSGSEGAMGLYWRLQEAGQTPLGWDPPNGYPDVAAAWINAGGMLNRWSSHRALTQNWYDGFKGLDARKDFAPRAGETSGQWVDRVSRRIVGQVLAPKHRAALLEFALAKETSPATQVHNRAEHVVALLFDSAYFQLR